MNEGLSNDERREWARLLYTKHDKTVGEVASTVGTDEATVRNWIRSGEWDTVKRSLLVSKFAQLERLYILLEQLSARTKNVDEINPKDVDLIMKYTAAIKNLETDNGMAAIIEVAEQFTNWLHRRDLELTKEFTLRFDAFIKENRRPFT